MEQLRVDFYDILSTHKQIEIIAILFDVTSAGMFAIFSSILTAIVTAIRIQILSSIAGSIMS